MRELQDALEDKNEVPAAAEADLPARTIWLMAISVGVIVANIYYAQPLLADLAADFHLRVTTAGAIAMLMQVGTACGMLFFVPLGDTHERRALITRLTLLAAVALAFFASARNVWWLSIAGLAVGMLGATVHVIIPFAANLAPEKQRGRVLGFVFSGLLFGILLARTFSGLIGSQFGWRAVFWIASGMMLVIAALIRTQLPKSEPTVRLRWIELVRSAGVLIRKHAVLREAAIQGALFFAGFSAFWTTLVFRLETPPFHYGSSAAGLFGLVGAAGAAGAPLVGHLADRRGPRVAVAIALVVAALSFVVMGFGGATLVGLIAGVILLDLGVQSGHVANQTRIYALDPHARSRLNMVYMVTYFLGGAFGSYAGAAAWHTAGWWGVCCFGLVCLIPGMWLVVTSRRRTA